MHPDLAFSALAAEGQQAARVYRLGYLGISSASDGLDRPDVFRQGLRELGYLEGRNVVLEIRYADGKLERLPIRKDLRPRPTARWRSSRAR